MTPGLILDEVQCLKKKKKSGQDGAESRAGSWVEKKKLENYRSLKPTLGSASPSKGRNGGSHFQHPNGRPERLLEGQSRIEE